MKNLKYSIGIDMAKNDFKACLVTINELQKVTVKSSGTFANNAEGFSSFLDWSNKNRKEDIPLFFLLEATGVYHEQLAWSLYNQGMDISIVLPNHAKKYLQSLGIKSKNDKIDAKGLAQMCAEKCLPLWRPISKSLYELRGLTRLHEDLRKQRTVFTNQLHALQFTMHPLKEVEQSLAKLVGAMDKEIAKTEDRIKAVIKKDKKLKSKYEHLTLVKGIGLMSFAVVVAETNGFELFQNKSQLVSYAGYDVIENQSGTKRGKTRISKKGNAHIRRILHMSALNAAKYEPGFSTFYERVYSNTNIKMKAYVAVQKKLLCLMYTLWKKDEPYDPDFQNKHSKEGAIDPLLVGSSGTIMTITKKPSTKALASQDGHSTAIAMSPLLVL